MDVVEQEDAALQRGDQAIQLAPVHACARLGQRALQPVEQPLFVAIGLQLADEPGPGVGQPLVIEIDRVLRRQHDAQAECARLLEQGEHRALAGRVGRGREEAEHLVHVEQAAQARRARLAAHPTDDVFEQDGDEEHPLGVAQVRDVEDGVPRLARRRVQQRGDVERLSLQPGPEAGRGHDVVERHRQVEAILLRVERVEIQHAHLAEGRLLHGLDQPRQIQILSPAPGVFDDGREQDVLAAAHRVGVDADQPQQRGDGPLDALAQRLDLVVPVERGRLEAAEHADGQPRVRAGGVDGEVRGLLERPDPFGAFLPARQPVAPQFGLRGRELLRRLILAPRIVRVDPGQEVLRL
ncbi:MAG: hypothetical protein BWY52_03324 [Chloroflexi bacterium ADurb.Bin325]|nr:MAG: hypothetical protein BWY52_03324 [Chloroflexi bacterium ADurb.Bin325]